MTIQNELERLAKYLPLEKLMDKVNPPLKLLPENPTHILPSIVISGDGLTLSSVLLVTNKYLCDVALTDPTVSFDLVAKDTVRNYRFRLWTHDIKEGDVLKTRFEVAEIQLLHVLMGPGGGLTTRITYAGDDRDAWLKRVLEAIPLTLILETREGTTIWEPPKR